MLRFDKMTVKAQEAVQEAQEVGRGHENQADRTVAPPGRAGRSNRMASCRRCSPDWEFAPNC